MWWQNSKSNLYKNKFLQHWTELYFFVFFIALIKFIFKPKANGKKIESNTCYCHHDGELIARVLRFSINLDEEPVSRASKIFKNPSMLTGSQKEMSKLTIINDYTKQANSALEIASASDIATSNFVFLCIFIFWLANHLLHVR